MSSKRSGFGIAFVLFLVIVVSMIVFLLFREVPEDDDVEDVDVIVELEADGTTYETLEFNNALDLFPGEKTEYTLQITCAADGKYQIDFAFVETKEGTLQNFINVELKIGEEVIGSGNLATLFDGEEINYKGDFSSTDPVELVVVYSMPLETTNEAQGATTSFNLELTARRA